MMKSIATAASVKLDETLRIVCPVCNMIPPPTLSGGIRWKWVTLHILFWCKGEVIE